MIVSLVFVAASPADEAALQLSLLPGIALQRQTTTITALSLNLWGANEQRALAIGFVNGSFGQSGGLSAGLVNYAENYTGMQLAFLNVARADFTGLQAGWVNYTADVLHGVQLGLLNSTGRLRGLQVGLANMASQSDDGLQLGFINLMPETRYWFSGGMAHECAPVMVFANWRFN